MSNKPQIVTHYADGTPSEIRDMTPKEIAELAELTNEDLPIVG